MPRKRADKERFEELKNSERLWKVLRLLMLGPHTTRQLQRATDSTGTSATICELRRNLIPVISTPVGRTVEYSLLEG